MKLLYLGLLLLAFHIHPTAVHTQSRHNNTWVLGTFPNNPAQSKGGTLLDFSTEPPQMTWFDLPAPTITPLQAISGHSGDLLFYTNGCDIFNRQHRQMANGDAVNQGRIYERFCLEDFLGYPAAQGHVILPFPKSSSLYYVVYVSINENTWRGDRLLYAVVDMELDDGLGAVVQKNELVMRDTALQLLLCAVRHANGRDWWIVSQRAVEPMGVFTVLLSPEGFGQPVFHPILPHLYDPTNGQSCFSPDGSKFCLNTGRYIYVLDFDRCRGTFPTMQYWPLPVDNSVGFTAGGIAVSPNSEYLYVATGAKMHQYKIRAADIEATRVILTGVQDPAATFQSLALAPDGKIYGSIFGTSDRLHVVQRPDEDGAACQFEALSFVLPTRTIDLPYFPSYNLYDLPGSPCDTLCENNPQFGSPYSDARIEISPNPVRDELRFKLPLCPCGEWEIFDMAGRLIHAFAANSQGGPHYRLNVGHWPVGMYVIRGKTDAGQAFAQRFVVAR